MHLHLLQWCRMTTQRCCSSPKMFWNVSNTATATYLSHCCRSVFAWLSLYICLHRNAVMWRHQMETFSALLAICEGNSPVPGEFPAQRPVTRSFHVFFHLRLNNPLSKHSWGWWFETLSRPLWRHCYGRCDFAGIHKAAAMTFAHWFRITIVVLWWELRSTNAVLSCISTA